MPARNLMSDNLSRVPALLNDLADLVGRLAVDRLALAPERAADLGMEIAQAFCDEFGGEVIYIPVGYALRIDQRDRELYAAYLKSGRNIHAAAKAAGVSVHTAYRRVKLVETRELAERQPQLFGDEPESDPT